MPTTGTASTRHPLRGPQSESMVREKGWNTTDFVLPVPNLALIVNWYVPAVWESRDGGCAVVIVDEAHVFRQLALLR